MLSSLWRVALSWLTTRASPQFLVNRHSFLISSVGLPSALPRTLKFRASAGAPRPAELLSHKLNTLEIEVPKTWKVGQKLAVKIPGGKTIAVDAPPGQQPGSSFAIGLGAAPAGMGKVQLKLAEVLHPHIRRIARPMQKLRKVLHSDLTHYSSMLAYERKLRTTMGHIKHTWPDKKFGPMRKFMVKSGHILADNFWAEGPDAEGAPGFDPNEPNGFAGGPPDEDNINGSIRLVPHLPSIWVL